MSCMCCGPRTAKGDRLFAKVAIAIDDPSKIDDELRTELAELKRAFVRYAKTDDEREFWEQAGETRLVKSLFRMLSNRTRGEASPS